MTTAQIAQLVTTLAELRRERDRLAAQGEFTAPLQINDRILRIKDELRAAS